MTPVVALLPVDGIIPVIDKKRRMKQSKDQCMKRGGPCIGSEIGGWAQISEFDLWLKKKIICG